ncbi:15129_t:CDS:2 [Acaulospora morrowiae]|uniref:15129_t:CDS:1 n=1 Tax=Acaulospora morrowiae TaxID=94023 RepID=A0A9N9DKD7_9GLOM|nr:15129_t:CDS:2 [Acaulospora morrowiae]
MRHTRLVDLENLPTGVNDLRETFSNLNDIISNEVTEEEIKEFINIAKSIDEDTLNEAAFNEINELTKLYIRIEEKSQQIYENLGKIDGYDLDDEKRWAPEWDKLCRRYKDLIINSKRNAATLSTFAKNLVIKLLPILKNNNVSDEQKEKLINRIKESINNNIEKAKKNYLDFNQYTRDVIAFKSTYDSWAQTKIDKKIENLEAEINKLKEEISYYDDNIHKIAFNNSIFFFGIATVAIALLAPSVTLGAIVGTVAVYGCSYAALKMKISGMKSKLGEKQKELVMAQEVSELSKQIIEPLNEFSRITKIVYMIWEAVIRCLDYFLNNSDYDLFFKNLPGEFESLVKYWIVLAKCLDRYVAELTKVNLE